MSTKDSIQPDGSAVSHQPPKESLVESLQSLIVAFVLAMAFRSFVLEGFVIPTGSMAPTLMGQHIRYRSPLSGYEFALDSAPAFEAIQQRRGDARGLNIGVREPMVWTPGPSVHESVTEMAQRSRSGDRVLVLKALYPFSEPRRYDVVVFKNPTDPFSEAQNYIKRLVGLPRERILFADGDVFTAPLEGEGIEDLRIQRKPIHVQRAVWQPVHDMDWPLVDDRRAVARLREAWRGSPWSAPGWSVEDRRVLRDDSTAPSTIVWNPAARPLDDWTAYNALRGPILTFPVSDLRIAASLVADDSAALRSSLRLTARRHVFAFDIADGTVTLSMWPVEDPERIVSASSPVRMPAPGRAADLEFWHVDQRLSVHLGGREMVALEYDWNPRERLHNAINGRTLAQYSSEPVGQQPTPAQIEWEFSGSALRLHRLRIDRDLYYQPSRLKPELEQFGVNGEFIQGLGFGTDPFRPGRIPDDHFLMLGDNSAASRDGRVWGRAHPLVSIRFGENEPFLVRRQLLLGKAWSVYFPAPMPIGESGRTLIPDFGHLRFIR